MGSAEYYYRKNPKVYAPPVGVDLTKRGISPLSVLSLDSTQAIFTRANCPVRSISGPADTLFTSAIQTDIDTTSGGGLTLENSLKDAHTNDYSLIIRIRCGERTPHWTATDPTHPINVWISQNGKGTNATPQDSTDVPPPWNSNASVTDIVSSVNNSNLLYWTDKWVGIFAKWLIGQCPLATDGHSRWKHVHFIPAFQPSTYSTELQIASSINDTSLRQAIEQNTSPITGIANCKAAYIQAWKHAIDTCMTLLPVEVPVAFSGANMSWDSPHNVATDMQFVIGDYGIDKYGSRFVAHRTDWRYDYPTTFGGGPGSATSPYSWFTHCYSKNSSIAIQTAGDGGVLEGATVSTDLDKINAFVQTIENLTMIAPMNKWLVIETSTSMTSLRSSGNWLNGYHGRLNAYRDFIGNADACISEYLYSIAGSVLSRL